MQRQLAPVPPAQPQQQLQPVQQPQQQQDPAQASYLQSLLSSLPPAQLQSLFASVMGVGFRFLPTN